MGSEGPCTVGGKRQAQSCTICGLTAPERNLCDPVLDDGAGNNDACGVSSTNATDGTVSIVPALSACKMNMIPEFTRVNGVVGWSPEGSSAPRYILENPGQELYDASLGLSEYQYPVVRAYRGDDIVFAMTAVDRDDCTELELHPTTLPHGAMMEDPEYLDEYPEFPEGRMVRRVFNWPGPVLDTMVDERPAASMVCFYATDKYLLTSQPFYCVEILIDEQPSDLEQTLMRFDCKLSLDWNPLLRRFVVTDAPWEGPTAKYYTKCEYEDFMWHHAMVSMQENGDAILYVDGEPQEMITGIGKVPQQVTQFGRGTDVGTTISISSYANMCPPDYAPPPAPGSRRLLQDEDMDMSTADIAGGTESPLYGKFQENAGTDQPVDDGFDGETDPSFNNTALGCCSFHVANGCSADTVSTMKGGAESDSFAGLSDEVVIWNRALTMDEIREAMFKMPQYLPTHKLEAPHGVQMDLTAGRVLYARFNNPCMEGLLLGTPATRKLQQDADAFVFTTGMGSSSWIGGLDFEQIRRQGISDEAGFTAGNYVDADGYLKVRDWDNDTLTFTGWREHAGYAYTGVPWAAPIVHTVDPGMAVPLDGEIEVTVKGIGFARSPFLKCATIQPDVRGEYVMEPEYDPRETAAGYRNRFLNVDGSFLTSSSPWMYDSFSQVQLTRGQTKFEPDDGAPELHPSSYRDDRNKIYNPLCPDEPCMGGRTPRVNCKDANNCPELNPLDPQIESRCTSCSVGKRIDWLATNSITSKGQLYPYERIAPLPSLLGENYALEYYFGGWETVTCQAPPAAFPSDIYYIGVSNDAGITGSPPTTITYTEYALHMANSGRVVAPEVPGKSFSAWFLIEEEAPVCVDGSAQACRTTIFRLSNGVGVSLDYGVVVAKAGMRTLGDTADEQFLGSLGSNLTTLGEWHHAMLSISDDNTVRFYLDGVDVIEERIDGDMPADGYKLLSFGDNLIGFIDEVKVFADTLDYEQYMEAMWRREPEGSDRLNAYYRLNNFDAPLMDTVGDHHAVCSDGGTCSLESIAAPWEPTTLYSVNGETKALETMTVTGGEVIDILGFNFAPSQWLGCAWGMAEETDGFLLPAMVETGPTCPPLPAPEELYRPDSEGKMGRPDGKRSGVLPYGLMRMQDEPTMFVPENGLVNLANSINMQCITPAMSKSGIYHFAPVSREALVTTTMEFVEVAYECDGVDDYLETSDAAAILTNVSAMHVEGYTISMWVQPYSKVGDGDLPMYEHGLDAEIYSPHTPGAPDQLGPVRQSLHDPTDYIGVIAAFEDPTSVNGPGQRTTFGSLVYDGEGFYYYDDCIADVKTTAPAVSAAPNEWHFVAVTVDAHGSGTLYVDGNAADHFTTNCKVPMGSTFSMCASLVENPGADGNVTQAPTAKMPNSHFAGRIDEVKLYRGALNWTTLESGMFTYDVAGEPSITYDFARGCSAADQTCGGGLIQNTVPGSAAGDAIPFDGTLVKSTGPWAGAQVMEASKSEVAVGGAQSVEIHGHNFAPSQWLKLDLGYGSEDFTYVSPNIMNSVTPEGVCHDSLPPSVTNADGIPENDGQSSWELEYECTTESLLAGLAAYYNMDGQESLVEDGVSDLKDSVAEAHGSCQSMYAQADRDGYLRSAFGMLDDDADDCSIPSPSATAGSEDFSVVAWVFLPYFPMASANMTVLGGWKLISYVMDDGEVSVYAGHQPALEQDESYLIQVMSAFVTSGSLSPGIWDDVWVYSRALKPCEVAGRYFTTSYALDLTKSDSEMLNGGTPLATVLPWGFGSVAAWVYAYNVHDSQSIIAAENGNFVLGLEQGRVSLAIKPGPKFECYCEPCETQINYVSWKARIMPGTWHHVAVSYNGYDAYILVDGVLRDKAIVRERCFDIQMGGGRRRSLLQSEEGIDSPGSFVPSRKLQGVVGYGLFPDCSTDGTDPNLPVCAMPSAAAQNDYEEECLPWMLEPDSFKLGREADTDFDNPYLKPDNHMRPFNGLIYDLRAFDSSAEPFEVKAVAQCVPKDPLIGGRGDTYMKFSDGVSNQVYGYTVNGKEVSVEGITPELYRNVSVDEATFAGATTVYGPGLTGTVNGQPGLFSITARTYCGNKRTIGGDDFRVTLSDDQGSQLSQGFVQITDSNDGTYAVSYDGLPTCGIWNSTLSMMVDGMMSDIDMFQVDVHPAVTDPTTTEALLGTDPWTQCSNNENRFFIQARDFNDCPQRDLPDGTSPDEFIVTLRGPADLEGVVTYAGDGQHLVSFVPPAPGTYFVEISLMTPDGPVIISNGQQCISVCGEGSMVFNGNGHVEVKEPMTADGAHYLDASGLEAFTMEAWVRRFGPSPNGKAQYVLIKGTYSEGMDDSYVKGYWMGYSGDNTVLQAAVYTGLGDLRIVTAPNEIANDQWFHMAAVYNGTTFTLYRNGAQVGSTLFDTSRPIHHNPYYHPVSVGPGFFGGVDEVKLTARAKPQEEIVDSYYCPAPEDMEDVVLYMSFNSFYTDDDNTTLQRTGLTQGYSAMCTPQSPEALSRSCLQGEIIQQTITNDTLVEGAQWTVDTPMTLDGVGFISRRMSRVVPYDAEVSTDELSSLLTIEAKDRCGYSYLNGIEVCILNAPADSCFPNLIPSPACFPCEIHVP